MKRQRLAIVITTGFILVEASVTPLAAEEFRPRRIVPGPFPALTQFPVASAAKAGGQIGDAELVLGVVVGEEARAYPINMLTGPRREILNDTLGGRPIAATW